MQWLEETEENNICQSTTATDRKKQGNKRNDDVFTKFVECCERWKTSSCTLQQ